LDIISSSSAAGRAGLQAGKRKRIPTASSFEIYGLGPILPRRRIDDDATPGFRQATRSNRARVDQRGRRGDVMKAIFIALGFALILGACTGGNYLIYPGFPQTECATCFNQRR
jgi:hypothetical protein